MQAVPEKSGGGAEMTRPSSAAGHGTDSRPGGRTVSAPGARCHDWFIPAPMPLTLTKARAGPQMAPPPPAGKQRQYEQRLNLRLHWTIAISGELHALSGNTEKISRPSRFGLMAKHVSEVQDTAPFWRGFFERLGISCAHCVGASPCRPSRDLELRIRIRCCW